MLRKFLCAGVIVLFSLGLAIADDIKGKITKIDGQKITVVVKKATQELEAAKDCKVCKKDKEGNETEVTGGLSAVEVGKKGRFAILTVDGGKVTKIVFPAPTKKKKAGQ